MPSLRCALGNRLQIVWTLAQTEEQGRVEEIDPASLWQLTLQQRAFAGRARAKKEK